jgi:carboxylate-amine ligase
MTALHRPDLGHPVPDHVLRGHYWRCARDGVQGRMPPLLRAFLEEIRPALEAAGDYDYAVAELDRVLRDGNGAARQRAAWRRRKNVDDVLAEIADATVR